MTSAYRFSKASRRASSGGFSLIELLVAVALIALGLRLAVPSMSSMIESSKLNSAAGELHSALARARQEAIARSTFVTVEPQSSSNWTSGYRIYVNPYNSTSYTLASSAGSLGAATPAVIGLGAAQASSTIQFPAKACDASNALTYASFDGTGRPRVTTGSPSGAASNTGRITACTPSGGCSTPQSCKEIVVDTIGRISVRSN